MKKLFLTGIALLLATGAAFAQDALLPPLEFDYDPPYTTKITRFTKLEELREACNRKTGMFLGCGGNRFIDGQLTCSIFILDNEWLHAYGMTYPKVLRPLDIRCMNRDGRGYAASFGQHDYRGSNQSYL